MKADRYISKTKTATLFIGLLAVVILSKWVGGFSVGVPFSTEVDLDCPNQISMNGEYFSVIDKNLRRVSYLENGRLLWQLEGGKRKKGTIYQAQNSVIGDDGTLYINNIIYDENSSLVRTEQLLAYSSSGRFSGVIYAKTYGDGEKPRQAGLISGLTVLGGRLYWIQKNQDSVDSFCLDMASGELLSETYSYDNAAGMLLDSTFLADGRLVVLRKDGIIHTAGNEQRILYQVPPITGDGIGSVPYRLAANHRGEICFSDLGTRTINVLSGADREPIPFTGRIHTKSEQLLNAPLYIRISASKNGLAASDGESVIIWDNDGGLRYELSTLSYTGRRLLLLYVFWTAALLCVILAGWFLFLLIRERLRRGISSSARTSMFVIYGVLLTAVAVTMIVLPNSKKMITDEYVKTLSSTGEMMAGEIDFELLTRINELADINSPEFKTLTGEMNRYLAYASESGRNLYYMLYKINDGISYSVLDSEDMYPVIYPQEVTPNWYNALSGTPGTLTDYRDSEGVWAFYQTPVYHRGREAAGVLELGINMHSLEEAYNRQMQEILASTLTLIILMLLFTNEGMAFSEMLTAKKQNNQATFSSKLIHPMMFLLYFAQCMQDAFIPILALQMYEPILGLPASIGGAIPISLEMLMVALFSVIGGSLLERLPLKPMLLCSLAVAGTGFAVCASASTFLMLTLGKAVIGAGVGLTYVAGNTCCAALPREQRSDAFASLNSGMMSGVQVGCAMGALVVAPLSYRGVYSFSLVLILTAILFVAVFIKKGQFRLTRETETTDTAVPQKRISALRFLLNPQVLVFLLLAVIPALMAVTYLEYYIPIFAYDGGLTEAQIGQVLLIQGALVIYTGPAATRYLTTKLNSVLSVALAGGLYAAALLLLSAKPGIPALLIFAIMYGIISGFMYSAQSMHYSTLPALDRYGISKGIGFYSMFQNMTQSFGPMLLGWVMISGFQKGTALVAVSIGGASLLFLILGIAGMRAIKSKSHQKEG